MLKLDIMTESELGQIFGTLDSLIPLHQGKPPPPLECVHRLISDNYIHAWFPGNPPVLFLSTVVKCNLDENDGCESVHSVNR